MSARTIIGLIVFVLGMLSFEIAWAERIAVRAGAHQGYGRMVFKWSLPVQYTAVIENRQLRISFGEPAETNYNEVRRNLRRYVTGANVSNGGRNVVMPLTGDYGVRSFYTGSFLVVDIVGEPQQAQPAPAPTPAPQAAPAPTPARQPQAAPAPAPRPQVSTQTSPQKSVVPTSGPNIRVRKGEHSNYTRVVFDWTRKVPYSIGDYEGQTVINFGETARYNLTAARRGLKGQVRGIRQNGDNVILDVTRGSRIKHFYAGNKVVVDVFRDNLAQKPAAHAQQAVEVAKAPAPAPKPAPAPAPVAPAPQPAAEEPPAPKAAPVKPVEEAEALPPVTDENALAAAFQLRFDFGEPVAAAAFRRGDSVWLVFDKQTRQNLDAIKQVSQGTIRSIEQLDVPRATVLRMVTAPGFNPRPSREGLSWIFDFGKLPAVALNELEIEAQPHSPAGARLFVSVQQGGLPVPVNDPTVGDNLVVVPVIPLSHGVNTPRNYPQFEVLNSVQGVVYRPLTDDLRIRSLRTGVELTAANGLKLSDTGKKAAASAKIGGLRGITRMFDFKKWQVGPFEDYRENKQDMEKAVAGLKGPRREIARMNLARFYLSHGMAAEALGVLNVMAKSDKERLQDPEFRGLRGVANFLLNRIDEAVLDFSEESVQAKDEGEFWAAISKAAKGQMVENAVDLKRLAGVIRPYPPRIKFPLALLLTEAALETGDVRQAESYLEVLDAENLSERHYDAVKYLKGRTKEISGDPDAAIIIYEEVEDGNHRPSRARASLSKAELLYKNERIKEKELIDMLEQLRFAWRGDDFEFNLLRRLGDIYVQNGNYRDGLRTLRQAATYFRKHPQAEDVTEDMINIFEELYLAGKADDLPPVTAIALYDEFRELTPAGEKGDEMIRKLADRLAAVDLLREAAELLENQVQFRLSGQKKAQVGVRLALVYLAANNPKRAIRALKKSAQPGMPKEQVDMRRHLEARALIDMQKTGQAIALLTDDESDEANSLRSEIYWNAGDWRNAANVLNELVRSKGAKRNKPLNKEQASLIMNLAVAYTLGNNERGVARVRSFYGKEMEKTEMRDAFRLISTRDNSGMLDPRAITRLVQPAENFTSFMTEYKKRLRAGELSEIN